jgi:hypothetical protein
VGKPEGKRPLGRLSHRWEDNIRVNLREIECRIHMNDAHIDVYNPMFETLDELNTR